MASKTWNYLAKVQALLAKAEDPAATPEEAAAFRAKAEEFMRTYRIEEEQLIATDATSAEPIYVEEIICPRGSEFRSWYMWLYNMAAGHAGVRVRFVYINTDIVACVVGYEGDARYAAFLFTAARLVFSARLEPEFDPKLSDAENAYRLRRAGIDRQRVARIIWGDVEGAKAAAAVRVTRMYAAGCAERGEDPALTGRGIDLKVYREAYAREFVWTFQSRLRQAGDAADSVGGPLQLFGRKERVDEAFYQRFPNLRPAPPTEVAETEKAPAKPRKATKKEEERYRRMYQSTAALLGGEAGEAAAREIDLARASNAKRVDDQDMPAAGIAG